MGRLFEAKSATVNRRDFYGAEPGRRRARTSHQWAIHDHTRERRRGAVVTPVLTSQEVAPIDVEAVGSAAALTSVKYTGPRS